jgi:membrane peptidoglycan carboxypeptidase
VVDRGTAAGSRSYGFRKRAAGKTGTTNDKRDAWFIGFTPYTLALTWIGFDDNTPIGISGSEGAVPIWSRYMRDITATQRDAEFGPPAGITFAQVDEMSGGLATTLCPSNVVVNEAFKAGTEPGGACPLHSVAVAPMYPMGQVPMTGTDMTTTDGGFPTQTLSPGPGNDAPPLAPADIPPSLRQGSEPPQPQPPVQQPPTSAPAPVETTQPEPVETVPPPDQTTTATQTR